MIRWCEGGWCEQESRGLVGIGAECEGEEGRKRREVEWEGGLLKEAGLIFIGVILCNNRWVGVTMLRGTEGRPIGRVGGVC